MIHGIVVSRENTIPSTDVFVTVDVADTFKGKIPDPVVIHSEKYYHHSLYENFEYVLFLNENDSGYKIPLCTPAYHALPSVVSSISNLDDSFMDTPSHLVGEQHLSEDDLQELEKIRQVEIRLLSMEIKEIDQGYEMFWTLMPVAIIAGIGIAIFFVVWRSRK